jgi:hypothetical protein
VNRQTVTVRRHQICPTSPTERAVYREASIGPEGATLVFAVQCDLNALRLNSSAHAAVLEDVARVIRVQLADQEQLASQIGAESTAVSGGAR